MKKGHNHSIRASALQIATCLVLLVVSAIIFASSFRAAPQAADSQPGFYPPLPVKVAPGQDQDPNAPAGLPGITISLPIDTIDTSVPSTTILLKPVNATQINAAQNLVGFQGDFVFDSSVVSFTTPQPVIPGNPSAESPTSAR